MQKKYKIIYLILMSSLSFACNKRFSPPAESVPGDKKSTTAQLLDSGAAALQNFAPIKEINLYLNAFHPLKNDFTHQMEAHHYCQQMNEDFTQCILYDANTIEAHMVGIEYIISEKLYKTLDKNEKNYWHPHNYEILSGQLVAPGLPDKIEKEALKRKINSYGKTWHVWMSNIPGNTLPRGEPKLAWSFNSDGQVDSALISQRDKKFNIKTSEKSKQREDLKQFARPQAGEEVK